MRNIYTKSMAYAKIQGSSEYPNLHGYVTFKQKNNGIVVIQLSTIEELSHFIGKRNKAIIGITDENFSKRYT